VIRTSNAYVFIDPQPQLAGRVPGMVKQQAVLGVTIRLAVAAASLRQA
jgi:hypothetical protein